MEESAEYVRGDLSDAGFRLAADYRFEQRKPIKMKSFKATMAFCCIALAGAAMAPIARADEYNRKTVITFSGPVEIPGVHLRGWGVLPAGTYVFKIVDSLSDRHIVQIFSADELTVYATILAIPNYRLKVTDKTVMTFRERPAGEPEALRAWFYPGMNWGEEFVYSKSKASEIALTASAPVLFTPTEMPAEVTEPIAPADAPVIAQLRVAPLLAFQPGGQQVEIAQVVTPPPPAEVLVASAPARELPKTAGDLPLMGLLGVLALCGGFLTSAARKRV